MMIKNNKYLLILLLSIYLAACDAGDDITPSGKIYSIAYVGGEGGTGRDKDVLEGILAASAADPLLDNGDQLEIVHSLQAGTKDGITKTINGYIERDHISAVLLGASNKAVLRDKQGINALGIPTLAVIASYPDITQGVAYISQLVFDDEQQAQSAALFVRDELVFRQAAVLFDDTDPHSSYLGQVFRTTFEQTGGQIDEFSIISRLDQSMLVRLKAEGTQIIYIPLGAKQVFQVLEQLDIIDWQPHIMASDGLLASVLQDDQERLNELNGMYVTDLYSHTGEFVSLADYAKRIVGFYKQMFSDSPSSATVLGIEGYQVIKRAMNLCPDPGNAACVNRKIRSTENQQGLISMFSIGANGKASRPVYISTLQDGQMKLVVRVN
jgi:branched-chain amino acid transport system substrate-binding protein